MAEQNTYTHVAGEAQGTTFSIIYDDPSGRDFSVAIDSIFKVIDHSMSLWDSTSLISRINRNETDSLDFHITKVINRSIEIGNLTDERFDITIKPLIQAWGFGPHSQQTTPDREKIDSIRQKCGIEHIQIQSGLLHKKYSEIQLDLNAIAQGYTVDVISDFIAAAGISNFLVEIGGEVRTAGKNQNHQSWQIGIDKPVDSNAERHALQTTVSLSGRSLATSGSYRKYVERGGKRMSHIIDPRTGFPVNHHLISVSVISDDCMTADAFATACMVAGQDSAMQMAARVGFEMYCIYEDGQGNLRTMATPGFSK